jgi:hypothetical protein
MQDVEGVIKYQLDYVPSPLPADADLDGLARWFLRCRERELIGRDPARYGGYAYGNISVRTQRGFVISGTQTGGSPELGRNQLAWVVDFDVAANRLRAGGPAAPSSEAMSHGQVYRALAHAGAVIHVHSPMLWRRAADLGLASTPPTAAYGTAAMAAAVETLLLADLNRDAGVFAMGGHEDGIVAYGRDLDTAGQLLIETLDRAHAGG